MKYATIEYQTDTGGLRTVRLMSADIHGDDPIAVIAGVVIMLSDRVTALERLMQNGRTAEPAAPVESPEVQLEMDLRP